jgi:hypothetical protein
VLTVFVHSSLHSSDTLEALHSLLVEKGLEGAEELLTSAAVGVQCTDDLSLLVEEDELPGLSVVARRRVLTLAAQLRSASCGEAQLPSYERQATVLNVCDSFARALAAATPAVGLPNAA